MKLNNKIELDLVVKRTYTRNAESYCIYLNNKRVSIIRAESGIFSVYYHLDGVIVPIYIASTLSSFGLETEERDKLLSIARNYITSYLVAENKHKDP